MHLLRKLHGLPRIVSRRAYSASAAPTKKGAYAIGILSTAVVSAGIGYEVASRRTANDNETIDQNLRSTLPLAALPEAKYADDAQFAAALEAIQQIVGSSNVSQKDDAIEQHSDSAWQFWHPLKGEKAQAVVYPANTEEVSKIVKICHKYRVPVVPYSGGTSLEGQFTPFYHGISIDLNRMSKILKINDKDMDIVVQPGVSYDQVNEAVEPYGLQFGPDPGPGAEIGGMVGTNASGTNAYAWGTMRANVAGLVVVLADGTIVRTRRRPRKSSAGYSLTDLVVGSEGTLAIVVEATLKLHPTPKVRRIGALSFPTVGDAAAMVASVLQSGHKLDAMELMDQRQMELINASGVTARQWDENSTLLLKFGSPSEEALEREVEAVVALSKKHNSVDLVFAQDEEEGNELWAARKNSLFSVLYSAPEGYKTIGTDTAVPISQLSRFIVDAQREIKERNLIGSVLGHVGDGNFHVCIAYNPETDLKKVHDFADWAALRSIELEGTCTGEHGIGMGKRRLLQAELGEPAVDMMRQIKKALDPQLILNPGKIFKLGEDGGDTLPYHDGH